MTDINDSPMLLGLHTYSLYMHGIGQAWVGFELPWERQLSTFELFDLGVTWGLDGFHVDDGVLESLERSFLEEVAAAARDRNFFLEYNMTMDLGQFGVGIQHDLAEGIETAAILGADIVKVSMDIRRPRPRTGSRFHPQVIPFLELTRDRLRAVAGLAEESGIRLALENHCDTFSQEVLWVIEQVNHPAVGACIDTVNAWHTTEDPAQALENLAPVAFTNHFRDDRVDFCRDGFKVSGTAVGEGDIDMKKAYELIRTVSPCNRIIIETEMGFSTDDKDTALAGEMEAIRRSIIYCREVLGVGSEGSQ